MNFIQRALVYISRRKEKAVSLFILVFIVAVFLISCFGVLKASKRLSRDIRTSLGAAFYIRANTEVKMNENGETEVKENDVHITEDEIGEIMHIGEINYCNSINYGFVKSDALQFVRGDKHTDENNMGKVTGLRFSALASDFIDERAIVLEGTHITETDRGKILISEQLANVNHLSVGDKVILTHAQYGEASSYTATLSSEKCSKFQNGEYELVKGRHITSKDKHACLISKELADYNGLSVGDKVHMYSLDTDAISEFAIVGIFDGTEGASGDALTVDEIPSNCGYIDYATMFEIWGDELDGYQQLTIYVEDPISIQNVYDKIAALPELKGKTLRLSIDTDEYEVVSAPLESLPQLVNTTIIIISVVSVVILTLLLTMWIKGRKKEIGILLSLGKSKANIILQIFTETFFVAVISFIKLLMT